jgi:hypothetical protein
MSRVDSSAAGGRIRIVGKIARDTKINPLKLGLRSSLARDMATQYLVGGFPLPA